MILCRAEMIRSAAAARLGLVVLPTFIALAAVRPAAGQTLTDERVWTGVSVQGRPARDSPWRWQGEGQVRTRDRSSEIDQLIGRIALGRDLPGHTNAFLGYTRAATLVSGGGTTGEHRVFEQFTWTHGGARGAVSFRTRFEQRFIENNSGMSTRVREQFRVSRPWSAGSRTTIVGWDEVMFHANTTTRNARGFDQNRAFVGLGRGLGGPARLEIGYLNQFIRSHVGPDHANHVLSAILSLAF